MADDELNYEDVVDVWEREKDSEQPCDLPDNFYQRLREYIQELEEKTEDIGLSPSNKKEKRMQKQYERVKKIAGLFFKKRQKKIVLAAYHKSLGQSVNTSNLIDRELLLLNEVSSLLKELKNLVFLGEYKRKTTEDQEGKSQDKKEEMSGEDIEESKDEEEKRIEETVHKDQSGKEKTVSEGKEKEEEETVETDETVRDKVEAHEELLVHIIDEVPPFVDLDTSYELNKEDVVTLHEDIAKVLIERGKARKIKL